MTRSGRMLPVLSSAEKTACAAAVATATGAVLCGVCCVLPFALPAVALSFSGSALAWLASAYSWATVAAVAIVAAAWVWIAVTSLKAATWPARSTMSAMGVASVVLAVALVWPRIEPIIIDVLRAR